MCRRRGHRNCGMASGTAREDEKEAGRGRRQKGGTTCCQNRGGDGRVKGEGENKEPRGCRTHVHSISWAAKDSKNSKHSPRGTG
ncbi:hypothetical protein NPIL_166661 [Nephila pilipes]|uniref:Uncharacterized protein n=1 Tax=Nephila pilipes TaxID=299642 RepID=A0A8X6PXN3_NEPPI|nr:hypothetical protein NPIL_166661 [Nephila pilipes]